MFKNKYASVVVVTGLSATIALIGCNITQPKEEVQQGIQVKNEQGHYGKDVKETTESAEKLPSFLSSARNSQIAEIYEMAVESQELLESIPCYCGCGEEDLHKSNKDCFISEVKDSGDVVWDSHAMNQIACVDIAFQLVMMYQNGASVLEVRQHIDKQYQKENIQPTPTPMPST